MEEYDEEVRVKHTVHEETTYEQADREYKNEQKMAYEKLRDQQ